MRIRYPFAGTFILLLILAGYIGLLPHSTNPTIPAQIQPNDKFLHVVTFFFLSLAFYWIADTSRRRTLQLSLLVCTLILGVGSEVLQGILPNDRPFDPFDLVANVAGSLGAIGLCGWYHRRMLERRRRARFGSLSEDAAAAGGHDDIEMGLGGGGGGGGDGEDGAGAGPGPQETGVMSLEQEVDRFDENEVDNLEYDEDGFEETAASRTDLRPSTQGDGGIEDGGKKRSD